MADMTDAEGELVAFGAGPDRAVYALHALRPLDYRTAGPGPRFAKVHPDRPQSYRARAWLDGRCILDACIVGEHHNIHALQPLGDDLLLACARSRRGLGGGDRNGRVYSRDGKLLREFALGDAIGHLQTTRHAEVWTGYFDEGVFGDDPVSACGLAAWDAHGAVIFRYQPDAGLDAICDCYALNVASERETWLCYYTDFPLVLLREQRIVAHWNVPVAGAHAFAVHGRHVLFADGYAQRGTYTLLRLDEGSRCKPIARFELRDEDGAPLAAERVDGRADTLYLYAAGRAWGVSVYEALSAATP